MARYSTEEERTRIETALQDAITVRYGEDRAREDADELRGTAEALRRLSRLPSSFEIVLPTDTSQ